MQIEAFEYEKNAELEEKLGVKASIGSIAICDLTSEGMEFCLLRVPVLSEKWAKEVCRMRVHDRRRVGHLLYEFPEILRYCRIMKYSSGLSWSTDTLGYNLLTSRV